MQTTNHRPSSQPRSDLLVSARSAARIIGPAPLRSRPPLTLHTRPCLSTWVLRRAAIVLISLTLVMLTGCQSGQIVDPESFGIGGEICDDGVDNDGDTLIDCRDSDCLADVLCSGALGGGKALDPPWTVCAEDAGDRSRVPIDLIWTVDSSQSMKLELGWIQGNLNRMVNFLTAIRADVRVILIGGPTLCVPEPLGGPNCTDGPNYLHVGKLVLNDDTLDHVISEYSAYRSFLRPNSKRAIVVASDDNPCSTRESRRDKAVCKGANGTAEGFLRGLRQLSGFSEGAVVHSIVAFSELNHPRGCNTGQRKGTVYLDLSGKTGGLTFPICNADWEDLVDELGQSVGSMVAIPCSYPLPSDATLTRSSSAAELSAVSNENAVTETVGTTETTGQTTRTFANHPIQVNAKFGSAWQALPEVANAQGCSDGAKAWYRSNDTIEICPSVCKSDLSVQEIKILHGCPSNID